MLKEGGITRPKTRWYELSYLITINDFSGTMQHTRLHLIQPMRTTRILTPVLTLFALLAGLIATQAQDLKLLDITTNSWRYYQAGNQPVTIGGNVWRASAYNDTGTGWSSGFGLFGLEDPIYPNIINTTLDLTAPGATAQTIAYYFRTHFNYPTNPAGAELIFTMAIDDGAAIYLNGTALFTNRLAANGAYNVLAAGRNVPEGQYEYFSIVNSSLLRQGDNVLAVEVHQSATNSSDVIFGLGLDANFPEPVVIEKQPQGGIVAIGDPMNLSIEAAGSNPLYQWFRNGAAIAGATNPTYSVAVAAVGNAGTYFARAYNGISTNNSTNVVIQVVPDTISPAPLLAIVGEGVANTVDITFNDRMQRIHPGTAASNRVYDVVNTNNYAIRIVGDATTVIPVTGASGNGTPVVRLTIGTTWDRTKEYYITFQNIMDTDLNQIQRGAQIGINFRSSTNVIRYNETFSWSAMWQSNMPPAWTNVNYVEDPLLWFSGAGPFYNENDGDDNTCMGPLFNGVGNGTEIPNYFTAYYFRKKFVIPTNAILEETTVRLTYVVDDGLVFYINGADVFRTNMPPSFVRPVYNTAALASWEPGTDGCRSNNLPGTVLRHGTNIIAVHLAQGSGTGADGFDIAFGLNMDLTTPVGFDVPSLKYRRLPPAAPTGPSRLAIDWVGSGWTLQQSPTPHLSNTWTTATSTGNSYTNTTSARFFRLRKP